MLTDVCSLLCVGLFYLPTDFKHAESRKGDMTVQSGIKVQVTLTTTRFIASISSYFSDYKLHYNNHAGHIANCIFLNMHESKDVIKPQGAMKVKEKVRFCWPYYGLIIDLSPLYNGVVENKLM